jgi:transcriptional regulator of acetoin/glycerol metabolism
MEKMAVYAWPGNVRELDHTLVRAVILSRDEKIHPDILGMQSNSRARALNLGEMSLEEVESLLIGKALARYNGNVSQAAEALGLSRGTFYRRMEKYGLYVPDPARKEKR